jgi:hypothetical protein
MTLAPREMTNRALLGAKEGDKMLTSIFSL